MNQERLTRLSRKGGILDRYSDASLPEEAIKLGEGFHNIVIGKDFVESNLAHPADTGFRFSPNGSELRQGARLDLEGSFQKLFFKGGGEQLNPLGNAKASSTSDPLPLIVQSLRQDLLGLLTKDFQELLSKIRSIPL